jgi:hypothetical protein
MPVYMRDAPIATLFAKYKEAAEAKSARSVGCYNFTRITNTLRKKGRVNQGLSYYYVDFTDMVACCHQMLDRLEDPDFWMALQPRETQPSDASPDIPQDIRTMIDEARVHLDEGSDYLKYKYFTELSQPRGTRLTPWP